MIRAIPDNRGITLVELAMAVTIVIILAAVLNFTFQGWMGRYNVESQIRQIYGDMMEARINALQRKRLYFVRFPDASSYEIYEDTNTAPDGNGTLETALDTLIGGFPKSLDNALVWGGGNIAFDSRGMVTSANDTLRVNTTRDTDYDCIRLLPTIPGSNIYSRIALGKWDGSNCVVK